MPVASAKVPLSIVVGTVCLLGGVALGMVIMSYVDTRLQAEAKPEGASNEPNPYGGMKAQIADGGGPVGMGGKGGGGKGGGGKGGGGKSGFGKGPNPRNQLTQIVGKLDVLTKKPLTVQLTPEEKTKVKELLTGLDAKEELTEEDAKARFDELLKVLASHKETLIAAGFFWPGAGGGPFPPNGGAPPAPNANPFKSGDNIEKLKSLRATLGG